MKKSIALVALAFGVTSAFGQDLTSKKGEPILPEAGDWSIGIDATPFLTYAQSIFGKTAGTAAPTWNFFTTNQTITGRYFKEAQVAYRGSVRLGFGGETEKNNVANRMAPVATSPNNYPTLDPTVENKWKHSNTNVGLSAGMEWRRGKTRLQGYYGGEVGFGIMSTKDKFTYGNALNPTSTSTSTPVVDPDNDDKFTNFMGGGNVVSASSLGITGTAPGSQARMTETKSGSTVEFALRGFIGAEYFILPKMSLGGEFGWGLAYSMTGASKTTWETRGNTNASATTNDSNGTTEIKGGKTSKFHLDTDNSMFGGPSGTLRFNLYF